MTDYIKRIQSRLSKKNVKQSRSVLIDAVSKLGFDINTLTDEKADALTILLLDKFKSGEIKAIETSLPNPELINVPTFQDEEITHQNLFTVPETDTLTDSNYNSEDVTEKVCNTEKIVTDSSTIVPEPEQESESGIVVSEGEKHDLISSQASCLGIELSEVEVVDLATSIKDSFLDHECLIEEVIAAIVTYHDYRTDRLEQKIKDAREHIEYRRKQLNQTLVGEFGEMNNFFRQGAYKRKELSKVIAAAFKT